MQDRLYRALLRLLPREVRDAYAHDMDGDVPQRAAGRGGYRRGVLAILAGDDRRRDPRRARPPLGHPPPRSALRVARARRAAAAFIRRHRHPGARPRCQHRDVRRLDAVLWKPLPYADARNLVTIQETARGDGASNLGYLTFTDLRAQATSVASMAAASQSTATLTGNGNDRRARQRDAHVGVVLHDDRRRAALGRTFTDAEDKPGPARRVVILSDALWRRRFGADPAILNQTIQVNNIPFTVVGVMPADFDDLVAAQLYQQRRDVDAARLRSGRVVRVPHLPAPPRFRAPHGRRRSGGRRSAISAASSPRPPRPIRRSTTSPASKWFGSTISSSGRCVPCSSS